MLDYEKLNKWRKDNSLPCNVCLRNNEEGDIIKEMLRRKEKYGTSHAFTLRRWVRMGFEQDKEF